MVGFVGISLLAWLASACVVAANLRGWYPALQPPALAPQSLVFARIWSGLAMVHLAAGLAAWLVWRRPISHSAARAAATRQAMSLWGWQLALGAAWPATFFGLHLLLSGFALSLLLAGCTARTAQRFAKLDRHAALLLVPALVFTLSLVYVSAGFWWLNR